MPARIGLYPPLVASERARSGRGTRVLAGVPCARARHARAASSIGVPGRPARIGSVVAGGALPSACVRQPADARRRGQPERTRTGPSCACGESRHVLARCCSGRIVQRVRSTFASLVRTCSAVFEARPCAAKLVAAVEAVCRAHGGLDYVPEFRLWRAGQNNEHFDETIAARPALAAVECAPPTGFRRLRRPRAACVRTRVRPTQVDGDRRREGDRFFARPAQVCGRLDAASRASLRVPRSGWVEEDQVLQ